MRVRFAIFAVLIVAMPAVAQAPSVLPGRWEMTSTPTAIDMPGAPPRIVAMMKGRPIHLSYCITPEKAKLGPRSLTEANKNCHYTRFDVRGSHIDAQMVCNNPRGSTVATSSGTFTPTSFSTTGRSVMDGRQKMMISSRAEGHRVGDCGK